MSFLLHDLSIIKKHSPFSTTFILSLLFRSSSQLFCRFCSLYYFGFLFLTKMKSFSSTVTLPLLLSFGLPAYAAAVATSSCVPSTTTQILPTVTISTLGDTSTWKGRPMTDGRRIETVYTTEYDVFCSTGLRKHTYTVTEHCPPQPDCPCRGDKPKHFYTTVAVCHTCGKEPVTATLTLPAVTAVPLGAPPQHKEAHATGSPDVPHGSKGGADHGHGNGVESDGPHNAGHEGGCDNGHCNEKPNPGSPHANNGPGDNHAPGANGSPGGNNKPGANSSSDGNHTPGANGSHDGSNTPHANNGPGDKHTTGTEGPHDDSNTPSANGSHNGSNTPGANSSNGGSSTSGTNNSPGGNKVSTDGKNAGDSSEHAATNPGGKPGQPGQLGEPGRIETVVRPGASGTPGHENSPDKAPSTPSSKPVVVASAHSVVRSSSLRWTMAGVVIVGALLC